MRKTGLFPDLNSKVLMAVSDEPITEDAPALFTVVLRKQTVISGPNSPIQYRDSYRILYGKVGLNPRLLFDIGNLPAEAAARRAAFARNIYDTVHQNDFIHGLRRFVEECAQQFLGERDYSAVEFLFHATTFCPSLKAAYNDMGCLMFYPGEPKEG